MSRMQMSRDMRHDSRVVIAPPHLSRNSCMDCSRRDICPSADLSYKQLLHFNRRVRRLPAVRAGDHLFTAGQPSRGLYIVRSGFFKSYSVTREGQLKITGFQVPGEILGIEGIGEGTHAVSVEAMDTGAVCLVPFSLASDESNPDIELIRRVLRLMSNTIIRDSELLFNLARMNAGQRIAAFLLDLSGRMVRAGFREHELRLPMGRTDIGSYLGLAEETVCRVFSRFQRQGILHVNRRHIAYYDADKLRSVVQPVDA